MIINNDYIKPDWPAPKNIHALMTTKQFGNCKDSARQQQAEQELALPATPIWLQQVHGDKIITADNYSSNIADASFTNKPNIVCTVLTADCLPLVLCDQAGATVAALHCGWKSLAQGLIENSIKTIGLPGTELLAWLGPAIGPNKFEVGADVVTKFSEYPNAFKKISATKWLANIYIIAREILCKCNVNSVYGGNFCTYTERQHFFSARRDGFETGRMATLIWREEPTNEKE